MNQQRTRLIILIFVVVVGLAVAAIPLFVGALSKPDKPDAQLHSATPSPAQSQRPVAVHNSVECPQTLAGVTPPPESELKDVTLPCLTTGSQPTTGSLADQLAGKVSVVNVWAWWCAPCRAELPVLQELQDKHPEWNVVGVHLAEEGQAGVDFLEQLNVTHLASYQDSSHTFDAATGIPKVVPVTLIYRENGTRAALLPQAFTSVAELEHAVQEATHG